MAERLAERVAELDSNNDLSSLRKDVENLRRDLASLASNVAARASEQVSGAKENVKEFAGKARDWSQVKTEDVRETIQTQPLTSVAVALSVGTLIGALLARR